MPIAVAVNGLMWNMEVRSATAESPWATTFRKMPIEEKMLEMGPMGLPYVLTKNWGTVSRPLSWNFPAIPSPRAAQPMPAPSVNHQAHAPN
ncbi:MAG: hypothetical protein A4E73_03582 [Syntrophaceae bacterium PtaU1.Bin231]|nr:MAG: hypothetical protein A4E73_03582 [Syntrophaceae bacterium PtaU1.Bin231]